MQQENKAQCSVVALHFDIWSLLQSNSLPREDTSEMVGLKTEVSRLTSQLETIEEARKSEVSGLKTEMARLTEKLHQRDLAMADLSEKAASTEKQLRYESDTVDKRASEIQVRKYTQRINDEIACNKYSC